MRGQNTMNQKDKDKEAKKKLSAKKRKFRAKFGIKKGDKAHRLSNPKETYKIMAVNPLERSVVLDIAGIRKEFRRLHEKKGKWYRGKVGNTGEYQLDTSEEWVVVSKVPEQKKAKLPAKKPKGCS
jgi:hypothetical protein